MDTAALCCIVLLYSRYLSRAIRLKRDRRDRTESCADTTIDTVFFPAFFHASNRVNITVEFCRFHLKTVFRAVFHAKTTAGAERRVDFRSFPFGLRNFFDRISVIVENAAFRADLAADATADATPRINMVPFF